MRKAAARLSAESPVRNAATRSGAATFAVRLAGASSVFVMAALRADLLCDRKRPRVDFSAWASGQLEGMCDRILDAAMEKRLAQKVVQRLCAQLVRVRERTTDYQHKLATGLALVCVLRQLGQCRAPDLLVQLGQFAADRGLARAHDVCEIAERLRQAMTGFEHHQRRIDPGELRKAGPPRGGFLRQETIEEEPVRRQGGDRERRQYRRRPR